MCSWRPSPRSSWLLLCHLSLAGEVTAKRKGALDAPTAQSGWRASRNSFPSPYSPSPACSLWTIYFSKLRERKLLSAWTDSSLSIAHSPVFTLPFFLILSQDICVLSMRLLQPQLPSVPLFIKRQKKKKKKIVFRSFLLTSTRHINRAVICTTTVSYREALLAPQRHAWGRYVVIPCLPGRGGSILYYGNSQVC